MTIQDELRKSGIKAMEDLADYCDRTAVERSSLVRSLTGESDVIHAYEMGLSYHKNGPDEINCHFSLFTTTVTTEAWEKGFEDGKKGGQR